MKKYIYNILIVMALAAIYYYIVDETHTTFEIALLFLLMGAISFRGFLFLKKEKEKINRINEGYNYYRDKLLQSQKMDVVGEFSSGIAHDFNNTLTSINGYVDLIDIDLEEGAMNKTREYIKSIRKNIDNATSLTHNLLTFSKNQIINTKVLNINDIITSYFDILKKACGDIPIELRLQSTNMIKFDKTQIEQILFNLVLNAKEAILEKNPNSPQIIIETINTPTQHIILRCCDNGIGILKEIKDRIFDPFFTTKKNGRGLGLTSIYGIIKQNKGMINVISDFGEGTIFEIFIPTTKDHLLYDKKSKDKIRLGNKETILFVEDNQSIRDVFCQYLKKYNYNVIVAENGLDAKNKITNDVKLVITDIVMPEMNGYEFVSYLNEKHPSIKTLYTSGYSDVKTNNFIKKPYSLETILQKIQKVLDE